MRQYTHRSTGLAGTNFQLAVGGFATAAGFLGLSVSPFAALAVAGGLLFAGVAISNRGRVLVSLHRDYAEVKIAPMAAPQKVRYDAIRSIDVISDAKVELLVGDRRIPLPVPMLEPEDATELVGELRRRRAASAAA